MSAAATLDALERRHPEWAPWLEVLREVEVELAAGGWDAAAPPAPRADGASTPLITGVRVQPDAGLVADWWTRLRRAAAASVPSLGALQALPGDASAALRVFHAALEDNHDALAGIAREAGVEPHVMRAVAALLPMPFLHACRRRWASSLANGREGHCPACGGGPALAELCGVERNRYLRCARCGLAWEALVLSCPYCGTTDHDRLATLVPEERGADGMIEVCGNCSGYLKAFTRLTPAPPESVMVHDLASVELDIAAVERGYSRPGRVAGSLPRAALAS